MVTEDDEWERIEREIARIKEPQVANELTVVYSIKLTQNQRVKLLQLGGPKWIREQIDKEKT